MPFEGDNSTDNDSSDSISQDGGDWNDTENGTYPAEEANDTNSSTNYTDDPLDDEGDQNSTGDNETSIIIYDGSDDNSSNSNSSDDDYDDGDNSTEIIADPTLYSPQCYDIASTLNGYINSLSNPDPIPCDFFYHPDAAAPANIS